MLIGHYGAGFGLKKFVPHISLGFLFLSVQLTDIIWAVLVLIGVEKVRVTPGFTKMVPLETIYQPFSHGLFSNIALAVIVYLAVRITSKIKGQKKKTAIVFSAAVFSHFLLDLPVHVKDMPILGWDSYKLGFGLWNYPAAAHVLEWTIYFAGFLIYLRFIWDKAGARKFADVIFGMAIFAFSVITSFTPPPKSGKDLAFSLLLVYLIAAGVAFFIDRKRSDLIQK